MDSDDDRDLYGEWVKFDKRMRELYEKEAYKFSRKLDKLVKERLGWRKRDPETEAERFDRFMEYVEDVYLKPSLNLHVLTSSRSSDSLRADSAC